MKLLFADMQVPAPEKGAGNPRAHEMIFAIKNLGHELTVYPHTVKTLPENRKNEYRDFGVGIITEERDLFAPQNRNRYDIVIVSRPDVFAAVRGRMREHFPKAALVYDAEALFSEREILKNRIFGRLDLIPEAEKSLAWEFKLARKADYVVSVSNLEMRKMRERGAVTNISVWGQPFEPQPGSRGFEQRAGLFFAGGYLVPESPNEHALVYFTREIFPAVNRRLACGFRIAGMDPCASIKALGSPSIKVLGYVPDLGPEYDSARIFVVPHLFSAGIPAKLFETMSRGLPAVVSRHIAEQLQVETEDLFLIASSPAEFSEKICRLYRDRELWEKLRKNSLRYITENCSPEKMRKTMALILKNAQNARAKARLTRLLAAAFNAARRLAGKGSRG